MTQIVPFIAPVDDSQTIDISRKDIDKVALIDADRYKHVVTYRVWQKLMNEGEKHTESLLNEVIDYYLSADIFNRFSAKAYIFCFSAPSSKVFRNAIAQEKKYKGHRKGDDPHYYPQKYEDMAYVYEYISSRYSTLFFDDLEADDIISMLQCENTFVFSHDKDLKQVSGLHWDMENYELINITPEDGFRNLIHQILLGDPTDNFGGLKGFGKKALDKFKADMQVNSMGAEDLVHRVMKLYTDKHGIVKGFDTFVEMWTLASMKINRGEYLKEKYALAFLTLESLSKSDTDDSTDA